MIIFIIVSCDYLFERKNKEKINYAVYKDISGGDSSYSFQRFRHIQENLNLESIENGFDSIQIRIWMNYGLLRKEHLVIFKNDGNKWNGLLIDFESDSKIVEDSIGSFGNLTNYAITKEINVSPGSGWKSFIKKLSELKIFTLPDSENVPGMNWGGGDLPVYSIEIATKKLYRFYTYTLPSSYEKNIPEAKNMEAILKLLEKEFRFKRLENHL